MLKPIKSVSKLLLVASLVGGGVMPLSIMTAQTAAAQTASTATGVVYDEFDEPYIGASVVEVSNPANGVATNIDGEFSVKNVKIGSKLRITAVGYVEQVVVWNGTPLTVKLATNTQELGEVVVTAMGIKRESKTLTYAAQTIKNDEVTRIKDNNFINSLQGRAPASPSPRTTRVRAVAHRVSLSVGQPQSSVPTSRSSCSTVYPCRTVWVRRLRTASSSVVDARATTFCRPSTPRTSRT